MFHSSFSKKTLFVCFILCLCLFLFSCAVKPEDEWVFLGATQSFSEEFSFTLNAPQLEDAKTTLRTEAPKERKLTVFGAEYSLSYYATTSLPLSPHAMDNYRFSNDFLTISAAYCAEDGRLYNISYSPADGSPFPVLREGLKTQEEFKNYALELLSSFVNVDGWTYTCRTNKKLNYENGYGNTSDEGFLPDVPADCLSAEISFQFSFQNVVSNIPTAEYASVTLTDKGELLSLGHTCAVLSSNEAPPLSKEKITAQAHALAKEAFRGEKETYPLTKERLCLYRSWDGTFLLQVTLETKDGDKTLPLWFALTQKGVTPSAFSNKEASAPLTFST